LPLNKHYGKQALPSGASYQDKPFLIRGVPRIVNDAAQGIAEYSRRFVERYRMLCEIFRRFPLIPLKFHRQ